jgi:hypothetical protein
MVALHMSGHDRFRLWLGLPATTAMATAQTLEAPYPIGVPPENELFLWLGLVCFAVAGSVLLGRIVIVSVRRRRRARTLRMIRTEPQPKRSGGLLRRLLRREVQPRAVRLGGWETRTRRAELKAEQATAVLRSELTPHLARMMKDRLVWTLMTQRARLLSAHQANSEKVATLEHRLTAIQLQIRKQAEAYESRIAELEKELVQKSSVTRELLKFRVILAKQALEAVRLEKTPIRR